MKAVFDPEVYRLAKEEVIALLKASEDWKATDGRGFTIDGIYDIQKYNSQPLKILLVLSESYGDVEHTIDHENADNQKGIKHLLFKKNIPALRNAMKLAWLLFKSIDEKRELLEKEIEPNKVELFETLLKTAWVNVKKNANPDKHGQQNGLLVLSHASNNELILEKQFSAIAPDIVILCGNPVIHSVGKIFGITWPIKKGIIYEMHGQKIICVNHPSARFKHSWSNSVIYEYYKIIYRSLVQG